MPTLHASLHGSGSYLTTLRGGIRRPGSLVIKCYLTLMWLGPAGGGEIVGVGCCLPMYKLILSVFRSL